MIRSDQSILCVEKIDTQTHHRPFACHKQITIMKSAFSEVAWAWPNSTHRLSPELWSVLNILDINLHRRNQAHSLSETEKTRLKHTQHKIVLNFKIVSRRQARNYSICLRYSLVEIWSDPRIGPLFGSWARRFGSNSGIRASLRSRT